MNPYACRMFQRCSMFLWMFLLNTVQGFLTANNHMHQQSARVESIIRVIPTIVTPCSYTSTQVNFWFGSNDDEKRKKYTNDKKKSSGKAKKGSTGGNPNVNTPPSSNMGTTATTMENFKQSQELGRKTSALLAELSSTTVEGLAAGGKIKVLVDGQQKPMGVEIDDDYFETVAVEDLTEKLATAMQDAHDKSTKLMQDRMESLYSDIGLPMNK